MVVGIIMGSDSDLAVMTKAQEILETLGVAHEVNIVSAHRTPNRMRSYAQEAQARGLKVIIAGAGGAAHLPGMVAAMTQLPVIGVPINATDMAGMDALLSIVQMPAGVPVATVALDNAKNAGILAARIIALNNEKVANALIDFSKQMENTVLEKAKKIGHYEPQLNEEV